MASSRCTTLDDGSPATAKCVGMSARERRSPPSSTHALLRQGPVPCFRRGSSPSPLRRSVLHDAAGVQNAMRALKAGGANEERICAAEAVPATRADVDVYVPPAPDACLGESEIDATFSIEHLICPGRKRLERSSVKRRKGDRPVDRSVRSSGRAGGSRRRERGARAAKVHARNCRSRYVVQI